jgi:hypothetical protein
VGDDLFYRNMCFVSNVLRGLAIYQWVVLGRPVSERSLCTRCVDIGLMSDEAGYECVLACCWLGIGRYL